MHQPQETQDIITKLLGIGKSGKMLWKKTEEKTMEKADFQGKNMTCNDSLSFCLFILFLSFPLEFFVIVVFKPDGDIFGNLPF